METEEGRRGETTAACRARAAKFLPQDARRLSRRTNETERADASPWYAKESAGGTMETVPREGGRAVPGRLELEAEGTASRADRVTR